MVNPAAGSERRPVLYRFFAPIYFVRYRPPTRTFKMSAVIDIPYIVD
jgi:hypothetical protein